MTGNVINLRQARKAKARREKGTVADQNRSLHGRTKAEKRVDQQTKDNVARLLDGHKRDTEKS